MKLDKKKQLNQKMIVQQKLDRLSKLNEPAPPSGWVKAIRGSLGLTIRQLAERMGVLHGSITQLEKREPLKKVTLELLERAAKAMEFKLVYALVPLNSKETIDDIIERKAIEAATRILKRVSHTMNLELQGTSLKDVNSEIARVAKELIDKKDPQIWDTEKLKKGGNKK